MCPIWRFIVSPLPLPHLAHMWCLAKRVYTPFPSPPSSLLIDPSFLPPPSSPSPPGGPRRGDAMAGGASSVLEGQSSSGSRQGSLLSAGAALLSWWRADSLTWSIGGDDRPSSSNISTSAFWMGHNRSRLAWSGLHVEMTGWVGHYFQEYPGRIWPLLTCMANYVHGRDSA